MNKIYIDFDGVIIDTWAFILKKYYIKYRTKLIQEDKLKNLIISIGWKKILNRSKVINNSIEKLKTISCNHDICILSKINSIDEIREKTEFLINNQIFNMCFVPYEHSKTEYVQSYNNYLIDDDIKNLDEWKQKGGKCIFFSNDLTNCDSYGRSNNKYPTINDLLKICDL